MTLTAKEIIDAIVNKGIGYKVIIPFNTEAQRKSMRTMLYRERDKWRKNGGCEDILISAITKEEKPYLMVQLEKAAPNPILLTPSGEIEVLNKEVCQEVEQPFLQDEQQTEEGEDEIDRIREVMEKDGYSKEEIEQELGGASGD